MTPPPRRCGRRRRRRAPSPTPSTSPPTCGRATSWRGDEGSRFTATFGEERREATIALPGRFNVANALAAIAIGLTQGIALAEACRGVASLASVPGRMERIDEGQPFTVIVDYAHTEAALRTVLTELRAASQGRLIVVFGAAGGRDAARRRGLGQADGGAGGPAVHHDGGPTGGRPRYDHRGDRGGCGGGGTAGGRRFPARPGPGGSDCGGGEGCAARRRGVDRREGPRRLDHRGTGEAALGRPGGSAPGNTRLTGPPHRHCLWYYRPCCARRMSGRRYWHGHRSTGSIRPGFGASQLQQSGGIAFPHPAISHGAHPGPGERAG